MIYTLTTNPCIDYYIYHDSELIEGINRSEQYEFIVAGKGVNVSKMLLILQMPSSCIVVCGGFTGDYIVNELKKEKLINTIDIQIAHVSRINVKTRFNHKEIDFNTSGPIVDDNAKEALLEVFDQVNANDFVCINGSLQSDIKDTVFRISKKVNKKNAKLVLDVPNLTADEIISYRPYLIKPNIDELKKLLNTEDGLNHIIDKAKSTFANYGINVLLSLGEAGSCYISSDKIIRISSAKVDQVVNTVASGDCLLAGFIYMQANQKSIEESLKFASATGSASVISSYLPSMDVITDLYKQVTIHEDTSKQLVKKKHSMN